MEKVHFEILGKLVIISGLVAIITCGCIGNNSQMPNLFSFTIRLNDVANGMTLDQVDRVLGHGVDLTHEEEVFFKEKIDTNNYPRAILGTDKLRGYQCQEYPHQIFAVLQFRDGKLCSNPQNGFSCLKRKSKITINGKPFVLAANNNPGGGRKNSDFFWDILIKNDQTGLLFCHGKVYSFRLSAQVWEKLMMVISSKDALGLKDFYGVRVVDGGNKFIAFGKGGGAKNVEVCFLTKESNCEYKKDLLTFASIWDILQMQAHSIISE